MPESKVILKCVDGKLKKMLVNDEKIVIYVQNYPDPILSKEGSSEFFSDILDITYEVVGDEVIQTETQKYTDNLRQENLQEEAINVLRGHSNEEGE